VTATETSRPRARWTLAVIAGAVLAAAVAGCGGGGGTASAPSAFAWLHARAVPAGWAAARLPAGTATLAYPHGWRRIESDPGTVSAAALGRRGLVVGYLNATPRQANESLRNWALFRPTHNAREGDRGVRVLSAARGLRFGSGRGSCVEDTYHTVRAHYHEVACLVAGARGQSVVVAAATTSAWPRLQGTLHQAVEAFRT
jgi:hypothetical protein